MPGLADLGSLSLGGQTTSFAAAAPPGRYFVRLRAASACGLGPSSNELELNVGTCAAPGRPTGLAYTLAGRTVTLGWSPPAGGASGYVIETGSRPGESDLYRGPLTSAGLVATVPPGTYYVRVRSSSACGSNSLASNEVSLVVP